MIEWGEHTRFVWNSGIARVGAVLDRPQAQPRHALACDADPSRQRRCDHHGCPPLWMPHWLWSELWTAISSLWGLSTELRRQHPWLATGPSVIQQDVEQTLRDAFLRWLDPAHPARQPRLHPPTRRVSFSLRRPSIRRAGDARWPIHGGGLLNGRFRCVRVPKTGQVKFRADQPLPEDLSWARVVREPGGDWFISFIEVPPARAHQPTGVTIGLDLGVTDTIQHRRRITYLGDAHARTAHRRRDPAPAPAPTARIASARGAQGRDELEEP